MEFQRKRYDFTIFCSYFSPNAVLFEILFLIIHFQFFSHFITLAEGLYELTFHNCFNLEEERLHIKTIKMDLVEKNGDAHYLSTGEMPLPMVRRAGILISHFLNWPNLDFDQISVYWHLVKSQKITKKNLKFDFSRSTDLLRFYFSSRRLFGSWSCVRKRLPYVKLKFTRGFAKIIWSYASNCLKVENIFLTETSHKL